MLYAGNILGEKRSFLWVFGFWQELSRRIDIPLHVRKVTCPNTSVGSNDAGNLIGIWEFTYLWLRRTWTC